jgi:hypothetical protein
VGGGATKVIYVKCTKTVDNMVPQWYLVYKKTVSENIFLKEKT